MDTIKETRLISIEERIITKTDILKLAKILFKEYKTLKRSDNYAFLNFSVTCDDNSIFESESLDIFSKDSSLDSKRATSVSLHLGTLKHSRDIYVKINHVTSPYSSSSYLEVKGSDTKWVNGTLKILEEVVDTFTPQNNFVKKYSWFIFIAFSISIGIIFVNILDYLITITNLPQTQSTPEGLTGLVILLITKYSIARVLFLYFFYWLFGSIPGGYLVSKLRSLWPSVEIQIGAEHKLIEKRRRKWLINLFLIGLLPLLLQVIYDVVKLVLK